MSSGTGCQVHRESGSGELTGVRSSRARMKSDCQAGDPNEAGCKALLESAALGIVSVDSAGLIRQVNLMAERLFGYERMELMGQPVEILLPEAIRQQHRLIAPIFRQLQNRRMGLGPDLLARRKDGSTFPVEISLSHYESPQGRHVVAFITDVTDRRRAEHELRLSEERPATLSRRRGIVHIGKDGRPLRMNQGSATSLAIRGGVDATQSSRKLLHPETAAWISSASPRRAVRNQVMKSAISIRRRAGLGERDPILGLERGWIGGLRDRLVEEFRDAKK